MLAVRYYEVGRALLQSYANRSARADESMVKKLNALVTTKDTVSYQGKFFLLRQARDLLDTAIAYCRWADEMYQLRPPATEH